MFFASYFLNEIIFPIIIFNYHCSACSIGHSINWFKKKNGNWIVAYNWISFSFLFRGNIFKRKNYITYTHISKKKSEEWKLVFLILHAVCLPPDSLEGKCLLLLFWYHHNVVFMPVCCCCYRRRMNYIHMYRNCVSKCVFALNFLSLVKRQKREIWLYFKRGLIKWKHTNCYCVIVSYFSHIYIGQITSHGLFLHAWIWAGPWGVLREGIKLKFCHFSKIFFIWIESIYKMN